MLIAFIVSFHQLQQIVQKDFLFFEIMFSIVDFHPNNTGGNLHYFSIICWPAVLNLYSFN